MQPRRIDRSDGTTDGFIPRCSGHLARSREKCAGDPFQLHTFAWDQTVNYW